ncbi:SCO family protein [Allopontixanthobacter sp.]|uniref:SCO family protein n=1 Tax=Allopontixanthobacter sp. TaxID=2906452 RepID=UPI002ABCA311|nr:SCO family protein [Allopontixanthobacter sp.]MDZ4306686.1 SCO family protein [Allopontixanthobacter sp.]
MNLHAMPHTFKYLRSAAMAAMSLSLALSLAGCTSDPGTPLEQAPLYGATIGGPFELTNAEGKTVRWSDFAGKYRIVYFGYTYCPDICPTDVQRMSQGLQQFEQANPGLGAQIQPIFITIDPERDNRQVVGKFVGNFHPRLIGLTGTPEQIKSAAKAFAIPYSKGEVPESGNYLMEHYAITYLFGPDGQPIATLPTDLGAEAVAEELAKWVR